MEDEIIDSHQSNPSLNLLNPEDEPPPNKFHLSEVRLEELQSSAKPSTSTSEIVESKISTESIKKKLSDKIVKTHRQQNDQDSNDEGFEIEEFGTEEDDDEESKNDESSEDRLFHEKTKKFTIPSFIEEVDEEMENSPSSPISDDFQQPEITKIEIASTPKLVDSENLLKYAKNKMKSRATSTFEQRLKIIAELKNLHDERKNLVIKNRYLNEKCCKHLKKITSVGHFESIDGALPIHSDQRYYDILEEFMEMKIHYDKTKRQLEQKTQDTTDRFYICRTKFDRIFDDFLSRELELGSNSLNVKIGKESNKQKIERLVAKQQRKFEQLAEVRVVYLKLQHRLDDLRREVRSFNVLDDGHSLVEFEQLMNVKHTLMDKLDEREEEIRKLRNNCTETVAILGHMKEKHEALVNDVKDAAMELEKITEKKKRGRRSVAIGRSKRDFLRKEASKTHSANGLLTNPKLFEKLELDSQALNVRRKKVEGFRKMKNVVVGSEK